MTAAELSPVAVEVLAGVLGCAGPPFPIAVAGHGTVADADAHALAAERRRAVRTLSGSDVVAAAATVNPAALHVTVCGVHVDGTRVRVRAALTSGPTDTHDTAVTMVQHPDGVVTLDTMATAGLPDALAAVIGGAAGDLPAGTAARADVEAPRSVVRHTDDEVARVRAVLDRPRTGVGDVVVGQLGPEADGPLVATDGFRWIDTDRGRYLVTTTEARVSVRPAGRAGAAAALAHLLVVSTASASV
ncbi:ESX secretion-associated protein EspG [Rhodococcoides corynebacterioides]|uniref:ESX secretion-associated protein EspG n=1 Tax=Rhodococcoides corynebacterioides TaxID=53972 RepID=A0ABS7P2T5_9NOCA|nr:ESX secretion-associated protein EspG [Rhodococcus corynebacterioides]MBY6366620.1 ESX secretion-associated protein EspG [Rhodococcus corynebacterioides]MBY6408683.1 ESX secretion-associated protein EspG [Rhodococcus corynebacterioides]